MDDTQLLALLVHRGHLGREEAEELFPRVQGGEPLDDLLAGVLGWAPAKIAKLRRTRAGEIPEIPGYRILDKLGTGGTADVWRAREQATGRTLALKVLKPECTRAERTRKGFVAEGRLLEKLPPHPAVVRGYGVARSGTTYFSRLELVDGKTLLELLDGGQRFGEEGALAIVLQVAEALDHLERSGVVHRDVKPGNVMLTRDRKVKLIDLGFAATGDDSSEPSSIAVGTIAYLAPEQARGGAAADARSDIYSLGISLFHVAVGRLPFDASDDREVLRKQVMESLESPELKGCGFSPHLQYFIEKMVAKDAEDRYQSWTELVEDVRGHLEGRDTLDFEREARARRPRPRRPRG